MSIVLKNNFLKNLKIINLIHRPESLYILVSVDQIKPNFCVLYTLLYDILKFDAICIICY